MTFTYKTPSLIIENISQKNIRLFDKFTIKKGQQVDIFQQNIPITESEITESLRIPDGDLYREVNIKRTLVLHHIDTYGFDASAPTSSGSVDISSYFDQKGQLISFDGTDVIALDPGNDGYVLTLDSGTQTGLSWTMGSSLSPSGSGTEIQYRSGSATLGAVTGSSVSGSSITLGGTVNANALASTTSVTGSSATFSGTSATALTLQSSPTTGGSIGGNIVAQNASSGNDSIGLKVKAYPNIGGAGSVGIKAYAVRQTSGTRNCIGGYFATGGTNTEPTIPACPENEASGRPGAALVAHTRNSLIDNIVAFNASNTAVFRVTADGAIMVSANDSYGEACIGSTNAATVMTIGTDTNTDQIIFGRTGFNSRFLGSVTVDEGFTAAEYSAGVGSVSSPSFNFGGTIGLYQVSGTTLAVAAGGNNTFSTSNASTSINSLGINTLSSANALTTLSSEGVERLRVTATEVAVNNPGNTTDFRVAGDTQTHLFFTKGSSDRVGFGTSAPGTTVGTNPYVEIQRSLTTGTNNDLLVVNNPVAGQLVGFVLANGSLSDAARIAYNGTLTIKNLSSGRINLGNALTEFNNQVSIGATSGESGAKLSVYGGDISFKSESTGLGTHSSRIRTGIATTTNATTQVLQTYTLPVGITASVILTVTARKADASEHALFRRKFIVNRESGGIGGLVGSFVTDGTDLTTAGAAGWTVGINASSAAFDIQVTGDAGYTVYWHGRLEIDAIGTY